MLVSVKWLRDYVDIDMDVKEFADMMTMTGTKMETVEYFGEDIDKVVVGKILEINPHPNADKLIVTKVDAGEKELQIVTGAKNVKVGDYIPLAIHGASLPGGIKIKKGKLRGEVSEGMMCSSEELGIDEKYVEEYKKNGIFLLDYEDSYETGKDVKEVLGINDAVIDFELTSNRPDCRCVIGIAREAAVTLGKKIKYPEVSVKEECNEDINIDIKIENPELCRRYAARVVKDVKIAPSPYWMQRRLIEAGVRPINNIVDITNYVMLEMGQPMHAFDLNDIKTGKIVVRNAEEGEKFTTLDDQERTLDKDMLVITDGEKSLALAGVMGGLNSEVKDTTTELLFESANFQSENIRATSKKLGLRTEASSRFEKGIDPNLAELAINRAAQLVEMLGAGKVVKGIEDNYPTKVEQKVLNVNPKRITARLGVDLPIAQFIEILESLEFECNLISAEELEIKVPSFRLDMEQEADVLEEIARIYGFENIPAKQLEGNYTAGVKTERQKFNDLLKSTAISTGLYEVLSYSFVSPSGVDKIKLPMDSPKRKFVKLINPLGEETSVMRTTMIPNILDIVYTNMSRKNAEFAGFECGHIFTPNEEGLPTESNHMCMAMYGKEVDFFVLKGALEKVFERVGMKEYEVIPEKENTTFHPGRCARLEVNGLLVGYIGELHPDVLENYGLNQRVYVAEIDTDIVFENSDRTIIFKSLPKYPSTSRDIALTVKEDTYVKDIEDIIKANGQGLVESYRLFDVYQGSQIETGYKSVAYSITYRSAEKTLTDDDIAPVHENILKELSEKLGAELRA